MKKLSIIVPIYNVERYLEECVRSLLAQTYKNTEIILVDDGSKDSSGALCDAFAQKYANIVVVHQVNQGLPHARNAGLARATGEYIGFVDSDDMISEQMYEKLISAMEQENADMAVCNFAIINKQGVRVVSGRYGSNVFRYTPGQEPLLFDYAMDAVWNKVYRANLIKQFELKFEDKSIVAQEDFWFLMRYCAHISTVASVPDAFYRYRERGSSITKSGSDKDITKRCIRFIELTEAYIQSVGRYSEDFLEQMLWNLMLASINQLSYPKPGDIRKVVEQFSAVKYFKKAVQQKRCFSKSLRGMYDGWMATLLCKKRFGMFSLMESIRVRRLHARKNTEQQFE